MNRLPNASAAKTSPDSVQWIGDASGFLRILDQTRLPSEMVWLDCHHHEQVIEAIQRLAVRGAPAIGISAGYASVLACRAIAERTPKAGQLPALLGLLDNIAASRPTAVNLQWAVDRVRAVAVHSATEVPESPNFLAERILLEARAIHEEDRAMCHAIGRWGAELLKGKKGVLTHCNAGGLATAEYGTALSAIFVAQDQGMTLQVYVDETRPLLQGARLTAWELAQREVPATLICDSMAAQVMREGKVDAVIVGADRITARGDTANKIGTYGLAILARYHQIPFYVAAPSSTFDLSLVDGAAIPIEQRSHEEVTCAFGKRTAPESIGVYNPAFDVTPAELITAIISEKGVISPVTVDEIEKKIAGSSPTVAE